MDHYFLSAGYIFASIEPTVITTILGSCIAVAIYDSMNRIGGMNHFLLPEAGEHLPTAKYGDAAMYKLLSLLKGYGSEEQYMQAVIGGGGFMNGSEDSEKIGQLNFKVAQAFLLEHKIQIIDTLTGRTSGSRVQFNTFTGEYVLEALGRKDG